MADNSRLKVAMVSIGNAAERRFWSGTPFFARAELERRFGEVELLRAPLLDRIIERLNPVARRLGFDLSRNAWMLRAYARVIESRISANPPDILIAVGGAWKLYEVDRPCPVIFVSDGLFVSIVDYYEKFTRFNRLTRDRMIAREYSFVSAPDCHLLLMADWAAQHVRKAYDLPAKRVRVAPIGANFDAAPGPEVLEEDKPAPKLLWIGVDWARKGGPEMLEVFACLRELVPDAELHIVGVEPEDAESIPGVTVHGYLRKSDPVQGAKLLELFRTAKLFTMLSREEAFGLVYCEAAAYGLPCVGYSTGGVKTIVVDGETGILHPRDEQPQAIAQSIHALLHDPVRYEGMRKAARARFEQVLNWHSWGDAIEAQITDAVAGRRVAG